MSDYGQRQRPPTAADPQKAQGDDASAAPGGSVVSDRMWAQNRISSFLRAQRAPIMRKADAGGEHARDEGPQVSQPGDAAEKEADGVADHVADSLHGDKHESERPAIGQEHAPPIAAKLQPGAIALQRKGDSKAAADKESKKEEKKDEKKEDNRGRLQVQGNDLKAELSWPWSGKAPTAADALAALENLKSQVSGRSLQLRSEAFERAADFIKAAKAAGGVKAYVSKSFKNRNLRDSEKTARVDIEVLTGTAFV